MSRKIERPVNTGPFNPLLAVREFREAIEIGWPFIVGLVFGGIVIFAMSFLIDHLMEAGSW
jgi:uncharacterized membrane protein YciS (DUF1049 family)